MILRDLALVAAGGAVGALLRYLTGLAALAALPAGFPYATLIVNVVGCLLAGLIAGALTRHGHGTDHTLWLFLIVGVLGGLTTFSAFSLDTLALLREGRTAWAAGSIMLNVGVSLAAAACGWWLTHRPQIA